jgi:hypothetical protein
MRLLSESLVELLTLATTNWRGRCVYASRARSFSLLYSEHLLSHAVCLPRQLTQYFVPLSCLCGQPSSPYLCLLLFKTVSFFISCINFKTLNAFVITANGAILKNAFFVIQIAFAFFLFEGKKRSKNNISCRTGSAELFLMQKLRLLKLPL